MVYRPDIDGLRAVAVILVMLFHAEVFGLTGGYVGVDVFFVISGYLISQRVLYPQLAGKFSYRTFYSRRIRRLFPAMLSTVALTLTAGALILPPDSVRQLSTAAIAAVMSVANIELYLTSGYWDVESSLKPLLHTWSLGVEEQFYCIWPLLLLLIVRDHRNGIFKTLTALMLSSLALTALLTPRMPEAAFYLTPFRIYEFLIGALCIRLDGFDWRGLRFGRALQGGLLIVGLALILGSAIMFDEATVFPGFLALIPTIGAAMVIVANLQNGIGRLLANPIMCYIGLISYSLYLLHWPALVLTRWQLVDLTTLGATLVLGATGLAAAIQYHYVEQRFRHPTHQESQTRYSVDDLSYFGFRVLASMLAVSVAANIALASGGFSSRYDSKFREVASLTRDDVNRQRGLASSTICAERLSSTVCGQIVADRANVLVVGDSLGSDGLNILRAGFPSVNYLISHKPGCPLLLDLTNVLHRYRRCDEFNTVRFREVEAILDQIDVLVFSQRLSERRMPSTRATLDMFAQKDKSIVVLGVGPQFDTSVGPLIAKHGRFKGLNEALALHFRSELMAIDQELAPFVEELGGRYVKKHDFFCPGSICRILMADGFPLMYDKHHISLSAAREFGEHVAVELPGLLSTSRSDGPGRSASSERRGATSETVPVETVPVETVPVDTVQ